jgi:hypothetical protein
MCETTIAYFIYATNKRGTAAFMLAGLEVTKYLPEK